MAFQSDIEVPLMEQRIYFSIILIVTATGWNDLWGNLESTTAIIKHSHILSKNQWWY